MPKQIQNNQFLGGSPLMDATPQPNSTNAVMSGGVYSALDNVNSKIANNNMVNITSDGTLKALVRGGKCTLYFDNYHIENGNNAGSVGDFKPLAETIFAPAFIEIQGMALITIVSGGVIRLYSTDLTTYKNNVNIRATITYDLAQVG